MSLSFERNLKRRFHRVTVPLVVHIAGVSYQATDWSVGGFRIENYKGDLRPGSEFDATLLLPYAAFSVQLPVRARVARFDGGTLGCAFLDLNATQQAALHHLVDAALEGRLGDLAGTLSSLQTPLPPQERKLAEDTDTSDAEVRQMRVLPKAALFVATMTALMLLFGGIFYYLISRVRVPDGVIVGNLVRVAAGTSGRLARLAVGEAQKLNAGDLLFEIEDPDVQAAHAAAEARLRVARAEEQAVLSQAQAERARFDLYAAINPLEMNRLEAAIRQTEAKLRMARSDLERNQKLLQENVASQADYEKALSLYESLAAEREEQLIRLNIAQLNEDAIRDGFFFDGREIQGRLKDLQAIMPVRQAQVAEAEQQAARAAVQLSKLAVRAPADGAVYAVMAHVGETLAPRTPVLSLDVGERTFAIAKLNADEAVKIRPGMPVTVHVPTLRLKLTGRVTQIGQQSPAADQRNPAEMEVAARLVPVKIALDDPPPDLPPGIRAILIIRVNPFLKLFSL